MEPAYKTSLYENILRQIIDAIKNGVYRPGDKLPREIDLAKDFKVSRNCVREAMKTLSWFGVVESVSGQGTFVCKNALRKIENTELLKHISGNSSLLELMEIRMVLEAQIAFLATRRASKEDIEQLRKIVAREKHLGFHEKVMHEDDLTMAMEFHDKLAHIAGNKLMLKLLHVLRSEIEAQRKRYLDAPIERWREMLEIHEEILEHIVEGNASKARAAMYRDLMNGLPFLGVGEDEIEQLKD